MKKKSITVLKIFNFFLVPTLIVLCLASIVLGARETFNDLLQKKSVKRTLFPDHIHDYLIFLESNQYLHLSIESSKLELVESILPSDSQRLQYARFYSDAGFSLKIIC